MRTAARRYVLSVLAVLPILLPAGAAHAQQRELLNRLGGKSTLAIDPISGFRIGALNSDTGGGLGFAYAGPIGFVRQNYTLSGRGIVNGQWDGDRTYHTNTFWIAPSADYFVIDGLSIGGIIEVSTVSGSVETQPNPNTTVTTNMPTVTNFTIMPRIGYLFALSDRWGIWPRGGIGYASRQYVDNNNNKVTAGGVITDIDCGFIFRPIENVYFRLGPEIAFTLGASRSWTPGPTTYSANASAVQFGVLAGIGVMFDL